MGAFSSSNMVVAAELVLQATDEQGHVVQVSKAELLLVAWGAAERLELAVTGSSLVIRLDESWLRSRWPSRFTDMERVYLYLQADGYAAIRSEPFLWIGGSWSPARSPGHHRGDCLPRWQKRGRASR